LAILAFIGLVAVRRRSARLTIRRRAGTVRRD